MQVIVGVMLSQHPVDRTLLHPLLEVCRRQLTEAGIRPRLRTVLADSGYVSEENFTRAEQQKLRLLTPLRKDPPCTPTNAPASVRPPPGLPPCEPTGGCATIAAQATTSYEAKPWNRCSARSRPARR